jgi:hypothetical protein
LGSYSRGSGFSGLSPCIWGTKMALELYLEWEVWTDGQGTLK